MFHIPDGKEFPCLEVLPDIVKINVGGTIFTTTRDTLVKYAGSHLAMMVGNDDFLYFGSRSKDKEILFIDRNSKWFEYILDFLRDDKQIPPRSVYRQVLREASFYGIGSYMQAAVSRANEVKDAQMIRAILGKDYEIIKSEIIGKGPKFILSMTNIGFDQHPYYISDSANVLSYGTGERCINTRLSSEKARSIVSCLWNDLQSEGYNLDVDMYCLRSEHTFSLVALFRLVND